MDTFDYEDYIDPSTEIIWKATNSTVPKDAVILAADSMPLYEAKQHHETVTSYILFLLAICAVCVSLFIVLLICRYKKLHTRTNMYILNIFILSAIHTLGMAMLFLLKNVSRSRINEFALYIQSTVTLLYTVFTFLLALDWFLSNWKPHWIPKSKKIDYFIISGLYIVFFLEGLIGIFIYYTHHVAYRLVIFLLIYNVILFVMLILSVLRGLVEFQTDISKNEYVFSIASVIIFSFVPSLFHSFHLALFYSPFDETGSFLFFTTFIPHLLWVGHPIITFFIIRHKDKYFNSACAQFFPCSRNHSEQGFVEFNYSEEGRQNV